MIELNGHKITPTIFPDGTSQVWKIDEKALHKQNHHIKWSFENEAELMHILQLATLILKRYTINEKPSLSIPFLPYSRQDKPVSNTSTFALQVFVSVLHRSELFSSISTLDAHNPSSLAGIINNRSSNTIINDTIGHLNPDIICFPDKGATERGYPTSDVPSFYLNKKRNQETGEIEGLTCNLPLDLKNKSVLLLDDICDGGRTFIEATKLLKELGAKEVNLFTTHGIYSKGTQILFDAGINRIFNHTGEMSRQI